MDLPIPGSPPISTTDPGTKPPPRARSSSLNPIKIRGLSLASISERSRMSLVPARAALPLPVVADAACSARA